MSTGIWPPAGVTLAYPEVSDVTPEDDGMTFDVRIDERNPGFGGAAGGKSRLLDCWAPSDRRRLGLLSFKAYDQSSINCPTDMWSYQKMFIEQRRDAGDLLSQPAMQTAVLLKI